MFFGYEHGIIVSVSEIREDLTGGWKIYKRNCVVGICIIDCAGFKPAKNVEGARDVVKIFNSGNVLQTQMIQEMMKEHGIACVKKDIGAGRYMTIATGMSVSGADIYVSEEEAQRATELIREMTGEGITGTEQGGEEETKEDGINTGYVKRRAFAFVIDCRDWNYNRCFFVLNC